MENGRQTMAKKSRKRNQRNKKRKQDAKTQVPETAETGFIGDDASALGDLRLVEAHVQAWLQGEERAEGALKMMGRDAAAIVERIGRELEETKLIELARRLVPMRPEVETNLFELRLESIQALVEEAKTQAAKVTEQPTVTNQEVSVAIFDPIRVADILVKTGRVRTLPKRVGAGDIAAFPLPPNEAFNVQVSDFLVSNEQATSVAPLQVQSGTVFVGPPEASDGERLGSIRFDPFVTNLHRNLSRGLFIQIPPGSYDIHAFRDGETVHLHFVEREESPSGELMLANISVPPLQSSP